MATSAAEIQVFQSKPSSVTIFILPRFSYIEKLKLKCLPTEALFQICPLPCISALHS